jgi:predicted nuclease with TOPRIM domain
VREGVPDGLEERVDRLERVVEKIEDRLHDVKADLRAQISTVRKDLEAEKQRRKDRLDDLESSLERASVHNLKWEGIALSWLLVGPVLAGEPELLGTLLRWGL